MMIGWLWKIAFIFSSIAKEHSNISPHGQRMVKSASLNGLGATEKSKKSIQQVLQ